MALRRHVKNFMKHYSEAEIKVREATSNDPWGPSSSLMLEISDLTYNANSLSEIMSMIWHRLNDRGKNWRHVYKSLQLMDYLIKNGSKKVIRHCQEGFFNIQMLKDFRHIDEAGKDQGHCVREKSKQVIALLTDEQLLHNEREVARRTRRRTSYAMLSPEKASGKTYSPTPPASDPIAEFPPSENVQHFPLKASPAAEQNQSSQMSEKAETVQETKPRNIVVAKKSSEDLIVFSEDEHPSTTTAVQSTSPSRGLREELAATDGKAAASSNPWHASTTLSPSERSLLPLQKFDASRKPKSSVISKVMLKAHPRKQAGSNIHKVAETLFDLWSSAPEEFTTSNNQVAKSDFIPCSSEASVETIYQSPTFQSFDPLGNNATNTMKSTPTSSKQLFRPTIAASLQNLSFSTPGAAQTVGSHHLSPRPGSTSSMGTASSFSTFTMSSPESVAPSNTPQPHHIPPLGTYLSAPHGLSSLFFKDLKERIAHSFSPGQMSDIGEHENTSILSLLPDNSKCSVKNMDSFRSRTCQASGGTWEKNLVQDTPPVPNRGATSAGNFPSTDLLCVNIEPKGMTVLEEIRNAVCGLRGDFCNVAQELHTIRTELTNMVTSVQNMNKYLAESEPVKDVLRQM